MKDGLAGQGSCWVIEFVFSQMSRIMKNIEKSSKRTGNDFDTSKRYLSQIKAKLFGVSQEKAWLPNRNEFNIE